jgi:hypothetical protein
VKSQINADFRTCFSKLPDAVKQQASRCYQLWSENPAHPTLRLKRIHGQENLYSVRVGIGWRALGLLEGDTITWFWIGSHADYDQLIS